MLTYQARPRRIIFDGNDPVFPCDVLIRLHFHPLQPFGMEGGGGRTAVRGVPAQATMNANTGAHSIRSAYPLHPLDVVLEESFETGAISRRIELKGNVLEVSQRFNTVQSLQEFILTLYFGLPFFLNVEFSDPPIVSHITGTAGGTIFRWELKGWAMEFRTTTQQEQERSFSRSWERIIGIGQHPNSRRILAAIHYFYVACRIQRQAGTPGEFLAEVLLNLAKTLEVLFPPSKDLGTIDSARKGLRDLSFSEEVIEGSLLPALALRNHIDVAHVGLAFFEINQLKVLHAYTERAENAFRDMLARILDEMKAGRFNLQPWGESSPRREAVMIIERMRKYTPDAYFD